MATHTQRRPQRPPAQPGDGRQRGAEERVEQSLMTATARATRRCPPTASRRCGRARSRRRRRARQPGAGGPAGPWTQTKPATATGSSDGDARPARRPAPAPTPASEGEDDPGARRQRYRGRVPAGRGRDREPFGPTRRRLAAEVGKLSTGSGPLPYPPSRSGTDLREPVGGWCGLHPPTRPLGRRSAGHDLHERTREPWTSTGGCQHVADLRRRAKSAGQRGACGAQISRKFSGPVGVSSRDTPHGVATTPGRDHDGAGRRGGEHRLGRAPPPRRAARRSPRRARRRSRRSPMHARAGARPGPARR